MTVKATQYGKTKTQNGSSSTSGRRIVFPPFSYLGAIVEGSVSGKLFFRTRYLLDGLSVSGTDGTGTTTINLFISDVLEHSIDLAAGQTLNVDDLDIRVTPGNYATVSCSTSGGHVNLVVQLDGIQIE